MNLKRIRTCCLLLAAIIFVPALRGIDSGHDVLAAEVCSNDEECDEQIKAAKRQLSTLAEDEEVAKEKLDSVETDISTTLNEISRVETAIETVKKDINHIEGEIQANEEALAELDLQVEDLQILIAERMRISQRMNNNNTMIDVLSESEDLVDFIRRVRLINHLAKSDTELMEELRSLIEQQQEILTTLQRQREELASKKVELEEETKSLEAQQAKLKEQQSNLIKEIQAIESEALSAQDIIDIAQQQKDALARITVESVMTQSQGGDGNAAISTGGGSGMFIYPLASGVVTCEYMCYTNHTGIDLSSTNKSQPILAAAAGTVVVSGWHNSYGNYAIITHNINGQTYTTLYAHMSSAPSVSVGQAVSQGQQIGNMGSTGNSTGPHLHFEIYVGLYNYPNAVNPRNYVAFPVQGIWW